MTKIKINKATENLLHDLGIKNPDPGLAAKLEDHFSKVLLEVVTRRIPEDRLGEVEEKLKKDPEHIDELMAEIAALIPGLGVEMEEALAREYEVMKQIMKKP